MKIIIVGAGVTGLWIFKRLNKNHEVLMLERNEDIGRKLLMTGNGRCNLTNNCTIDEFSDRCIGEKKTVYSWLNDWGPKEIISFFEKQGIKLKEEDKGRVFPFSDRAMDILDAVRKNTCDGRIIKNTVVSELLTEAGIIKGVKTEDNKIFYADVVIVTTGGKALPRTGSTGMGYSWFEKAGHDMEETYPLETSWISNDELIAGKKLQGVSYKGSVKVKGKRYEGDFIITHYGFSGPTILDLGGYVYKNSPQLISFNFTQLTQTDLLDILEKNNNIKLKVGLKNIISDSMANTILGKEILNKCWVDISRKDKREIIENLTDKPILISGTRGFKHCFVTGGGLKLKDFNIKTLESKHIKGLYAAGEILNVHGPLGGYNITLCISQGERICRYLNSI